MNPSDNQLLAILSPQVFQQLQPHLKVREFEQGTVLAENGTTVTEVYFPYSGIVSLVVELKEGDMVEAAMVGRDGVVNAASAPYSTDGFHSTRRSFRRAHIWR